MDIEKHNLQKENILYLPIKKVQFDRIKAKTKRLEFRNISMHYLRRLSNLKKDGIFISENPIKAIVFHAGYNPDSPRMLVELKDWFFNGPEYRAENNIKPNLEYEKDFENDGLNIHEDENLIFVLGEILE